MATKDPNSLVLFKDLFDAVNKAVDRRLAPVVSSSSVPQFPNGIDSLGDTDLVLRRNSLVHSTLQKPNATTHEIQLNSPDSSTIVDVGAVNASHGYVGTSTNHNFRLRRNGLDHTVLASADASNSHTLSMSSPDGLTTMQLAASFDGASFRSVSIGSITNHSLYFRTNNTNWWVLAPTGEFVPDSTNLRDLGAATNRLRTGYFGTSLEIGPAEAHTYATQVNVYGAAGVAGYSLRETVADVEGAWLANTAEVVIGTITSHSLKIITANAQRWQWDGTGHYIPLSNNLLDVGSSSFKVRTGYFGTSVVVGANTLTDAGSGFVQADGGFIANNSALGFRSTDGAMKFTVASSELFLDGPTGGVNVRANEVVKFKVNSTGIGFYAVTPVARSAGWTITNDVTDRTFDANAGAVLELADVVATLIRDLAATGIIGAVA